MDRKQKMLRMSNAESNRFTRECICTALIYLMNYESFDKITITSIIERSGVSRAAFYRNYRSKNDILMEIDQKLYDNITEMFHDQTVTENPHSFLVNFFTQIKTLEKEFRLFLQAKYPPDFTFSISRNLITTQITSKKDYYTNIVIASSLRDITIDWYQNGMKETPEEMADILVEIFHLSPKS